MHAAKRVTSALAVVLAAIFALIAFGAAASAADPYSSGSSVSGSTQNPAVGGTMTVSGTGFCPNATVNIGLDTQATPLGSAPTDSAGSFSTQVTLPAGVSGKHNIVFAGSCGGSGVLAISIGTSGGTNGGGGGLSNTGVAVLGIGTVGLALLLGGGLMLMAGRRRKVIS